jgi:argininosuccinate lyase
MSLLTVMKSLPLAYNKDMQEDKEAVFNAADTIRMCLEIFRKMLDLATFNRENMYSSAKGGYTNATDVADWLVKKGLPFRDAHEIVGKLVLYAIKQKKPIENLSIGELKSISDIFDESLYTYISVEASVNARKIAGGTSEAAIDSAIEQYENFLTERHGHT